MSGDTYRPEIDGLRAVAVVLVVLYHLGWIFPGGFIGVDVFFVISGFLITGILSRELGQQRFSLADFWVRRIRRIMPASVVMVLATLAAGYRWLLPSGLVDLGKSAMAQIAMVSNIYFWGDTGYFAARADTKPLLHTWSLAVEEQFYLIYPLVLMILWRVESRLRFRLLLAALLLSLGLSCYTVSAYPEATYYLLPTRAWELLVGCLLALWRTSPEVSVHHARGLSIVGLLAILIPSLIYTRETPFPGAAAVPPVLGTALVIFATSQSRELWVCRLLSWKPLVGMGLISYSLYLWHWPVIAFGNLRWGHVTGWYAVAALVLSVGLAIASWWLVETPFRRSAWWGPRSRLVFGAVAGNLLVMAIGLVYDRTEGFVNQYTEFQKLLIEDLTWKGDDYGVGVTGDLPYEQIPTVGRPQVNGERLDWLAWGDSHLACCGPLVEGFARGENLTCKIIAARGVPPLPGVCMPYHTGVSSAAMLERGERMLQLIEQLRPRNLLLICRWSLYLVGSNPVEPPTSPRRYLLTDDQQTLKVVDPPDAVMQRSLLRLRDFCHERGIKLWIVKQVPETAEPFPAQEMLLWSIGRSKTPSDTRTTREAHLARQARVEQIFQDPRFNDIRFVDLALDLMDENGLVRNYHDHRALYRDCNHLTRWGLEFVRKPFLAALRQDAQDVPVQE